MSRESRGGGAPIQSTLYLVRRSDPAFDTTIVRGEWNTAGGQCELFGVEILNEGFGTSIDDTVIEQQATFVALSIAPLQAAGTAQLIAGAW